MTEQEAIELGKKLYANIINNENNIIKTNDYIEFAGMTIKALEEVQQYRAIGTPEECRAAVEKLRKVEEVVKEWDKVGYAYSNNHMCEIKMIVKGGGVDE